MYFSKFVVSHTDFPSCTDDYVKLPSNVSIFLGELYGVITKEIKQKCISRKDFILSHLIDLKCKENAS